MTNSGPRKDSLESCQMGSLVYFGNPKDLFSIWGTNVSLKDFFLDSDHVEDLDKMIYISMTVGM